jgi:hypothetical protein
MMTTAARDNISSPSPTVHTGPTLSRRAFVRSGLIATLATVASPLAYSSTWKEETQARPQAADTALLILDFQVGIGDQLYAEECCATRHCSAQGRTRGRAAGSVQQGEVP